MPRHKDSPKIRSAQRQLREASRRFALIRRADAMMRGGKSLHSAARATGTPLANLSRYMAAFRAGGILAIVPLMSTGRPPVSAKLGLTADEIRAITTRVHRRNIAPACREYATLPGCRPELAVVLRGHLPSSVRAAIRAALPKPDAPPWDSIWKHCK